jgi:hypothetical protein
MLRQTCHLGRRHISNSSSPRGVDHADANSLAENNWIEIGITGVLVGQTLDAGVRERGRLSLLCTCHLCTNGRHAVGGIGPGHGSLYVFSIDYITPQSKSRHESHNRGETTGLVRIGKAMASEKATTAMLLACLNGRDTCPNSSHSLDTDSSLVPSHLPSFFCTYICATAHIRMLFPLTARAFPHSLGPV